MVNTKLIAEVGKATWEAKEEDGKFFAFVTTRRHGAGEWRRVAKTKVRRVAS